ncbi:hypothetical protein DFH06DRAFT_1134479 [Mycena polygramma]|nr:hypothetical protein DFH06DRAFT_1134479 [Mycena polygramma]
MHIEALLFLLLSRCFFRVCFPLAVVTTSVSLEQVEVRFFVPILSLPPVNIGIDIGDAKPLPSHTRVVRLGRHGCRETPPLPFGWTLGTGLTGRSSFALRTYKT